jgi:hypothetical protein
MTYPRGKVYVTQEVGVDYSKAETYGDIAFLTMEDFVNSHPSLLNEALARELRHNLRNFNPDDDWIVISGSPYVSAAVFMILGLTGIRKVKILRWDNRDLVYRPMVIEISRAVVNV